MDIEQVKKLLLAFNNRDYDFYFLCPESKIRILFNEPKITYENIVEEIQIKSPLRNTPEGDYKSYITWPTIHITNINSTKESGKEPRKIEISLKATKIINDYFMLDKMIIIGHDYVKENITTPSKLIIFKNGKSLSITDMLKEVMLNDL